MSSLPRSAKVMQLGAALKCDRLKALGVAVDWFVWLDEQCTNGNTQLLPKQLDEVLGVKKLCDALVRVGWAFVGEDGMVHVVDFDQHNGETAKQRALHAKRQERYKGSMKGDARSVSGDDGGSVSDASANASPRIEYIYNKKGDGNATLHSERDASASAGRVHPSPTDRGYGGWVRQVCAVLPQLAQMRTLPPDVDNAARVMYNTGYVPSAAELQALGRFWAAPARELRGLHRPTAFRWLMESLPEVCRTAQEWCDVEDRRLRKEAATARRKAQETVSPAAGAPVTEEDKAAFFADVRGNSEQSGREGV